MLEYPKGLEDNFFGELSWFEMYSWEISKNQKFVEAIAYDISKIIWDIDTGEFVGPKEEDPLQSAKYSSDDRYYVIREDDSIVVSEKQPDGSYEEIFTIDSRGGFSFYSDQILAVYRFGTLGFFDLHKKSQIDSFDMTGYDSYPMWVISPDRALVAVADSNKIHLWDLKYNTLLVEIEVDIADDYGKFRDLTFSPDGRYLATSSWDGTVRLWGIVP
jgi:WD40 repeat protein